MKIWYTQTHIDASVRTRLDVLVCECVHVKMVASTC